MHSDSLKMQSGVLFFIYFILFFHIYTITRWILLLKMANLKKYFKKMRSAFVQVIPVSQKLRLFKVHVLNIVISGTHQPQPPTVHTFC